MKWLTMLTNYGLIEQISVFVVLRLSVSFPQNDKYDQMQDLTLCIKLIYVWLIEINLDGRLGTDLKGNRLITEFVI
jgi:hypothetical protein